MMGEDMVLSKVFKGFGVVVLSLGACMGAGAMASASGLMAQDSAPVVDESVMQAYRDYNAAFAAGDLDTAREHAGQAFERGQQTDLDNATLATLSENYANVLNLTGQLDQAERQFLMTRDLYRALDGQGSRAYLMQARAARAARVAFTRNEERAAIRLADEVGDALGDAPQDPDARTAVFLARSVQAFALWQRQQTRMAAQRAEQALGALGEEHNVVTSDVALLYYLAGIGHAFTRDHLESAYYFSMAFALSNQVNAEFDFTIIAQLWSDYARDQLETDDRTSLLQRLSRSPIYLEQCIEVCGNNAIDEADLETITGVVVNAEPVSRRDVRYPGRATQAGLEGVVLARYDVNAQGRTENIEIVASVPHPIFGEAVETAVSGWTYTPRTIDGEATTQRGLVTSFEFAMAN